MIFSYDMYERCVRGGGLLLFPLVLTEPIGVSDESNQ